MALLQTSEEREVEMLEKVEKEIRRHECRERVHHIIMGALTLTVVAAFFVGKCAGRRHHCHCHKQ